jgi:hypothetical protein
VNFTRFKSLAFSPTTSPPPFILNYVLWNAQALFVTTCMSKGVTYEVIHIYLYILPKITEFILIYFSNILYNSTLNTLWRTASKLCISLKYFLTECRLLSQHQLLRISKDSAYKIHWVVEISGKHWVGCPVSNDCGQRAVKLWSKLYSSAQNHISCMVQVITIHRTLHMELHHPSSWSIWTFPATVKWLVWA